MQLWSSLNSLKLLPTPFYWMNWSKRSMRLIQSALEIFSICVKPCNFVTRTFISALGITKSVMINSWLELKSNASVQSMLFWKIWSALSLTKGFWSHLRTSSFTESIWNFWRKSKQIWRDPRLPLKKRDSIILLALSVSAACIQTLSKRKKWCLPTEA